MNIIVCIKRVPDTETRIRVAENGRTIETRDVNYVLNPYDEFAVEEAIRLKERLGGEVTVICLGPDEAASVIRNALAMGADRGVLLKTAETDFDASVTAAALAAALADRPYDLLLFGKQAVDDDNAQVGPMVAELLNLPCVCQIVKLEITDGRAVVHRQVEGGEEVVETTLPAVFTAQKGLNEPRYASLKDIMRAKRATIEEQAATLIPSRVETVSLSLPPQRQAGRFIGKGVEAVPELIRRLKEEAKVL